VKEAKARLGDIKHIFVAHIDGCTWKDRGAAKLTPYHLEATVVRSHKGSWRVSERLAFVHYMDDSAPTAHELPPLCEPRLIRVFTNEHRSSEIELHTGEFSEYDKESAEARALECVYPTGSRP
jgi:hypothetical protein